MMIKRRCIARPHPITAKTLPTENPVKAFCALAWLTFSQGIIVNSMMLITFSVLEYFFTHGFTWGIYLKPLPTYKEEKKKLKKFISVPVANATNPNFCEDPREKYSLQYKYNTKASDANEEKYQLGGY